MGGGGGKNRQISPSISLIDLAVSSFAIAMAESKVFSSAADIGLTVACFLRLAAFAAISFNSFLTLMASARGEAGGVEKDEPRGREKGGGSFFLSVGSGGVGELPRDRKTDSISSIKLGPLLLKIGLPPSSSSSLIS